MEVIADPVDGGFDPRIEQFDNQHQHHCPSQQGDLNPVTAEPQVGWQQQRRGPDLLPEGALTLVGDPQAIQ